MGLVDRLLHDEDGVTLVLVTLLMIVLLTFGAIAVDLSAAFVGRRGAQTVADVSDLAGSQETISLASADDDGVFPPAGPLGPREAVEIEVKRSAFVNGGYTDVDWTTCSDPDRPPEYTRLAFGTDCISFTDSLDRIRVRVPDTAVQTGFARVVGINQIDVSAAAEVEIVLEQSGDILPFGISSTDPYTTPVCLSDRPNAPEPCNGPEAGNFNRLFITQFGNSTLGTTQECNPGNTELAINIAVGSDHLLGTTRPDVLIDQDECKDGANITALPNWIDVRTGTPPGPLNDGLIDGPSKGNTMLFAGRLSDTQRSTATYDIRSIPLDNTPLWHYIVNPAGAAPASCDRGTFDNGLPLSGPPWADPAKNGGVIPPGQWDWDGDLWDPVTNPEPAPMWEDNESFEHMARCLRDYGNSRYGVSGFATANPPAVPGLNAAWSAPTMSYKADLFTLDDDNPNNFLYALQHNPRWGYSPVGPFNTGSSGNFQIQAFAPVYIQTLAGKCNGASGCGFEWQAGQTAQGSIGGNFVTSTIAFRIPEEALPDEVNENAPGSSEDFQYYLFR